MSFVVAVICGRSPGQGCCWIRNPAQWRKIARDQDVINLSWNFVGSSVSVGVVRLFPKKSVCQYKVVGRCPVLKPLSSGVLQWEAMLSNCACVVIVVPGTSLCIAVRTNYDMLVLFRSLFLDLGNCVVNLLYAFVVVSSMWEVCTHES